MFFRSPLMVMFAFSILHEIKKLWILFFTKRNELQCNKNKGALL